MIDILERTTARIVHSKSSRSSGQGKFLAAAHETLWVKGVTYGTFRPECESREYNPRTVESDFSLMKQNHVNAIRIYTIPDRWMLDLAYEYGIRVFAGFPWEEHVTFLDQRSIGRSIRRRLESSLRQIVGHPAILCCSIGNEIPSGIVRWHGAKKVQRHLRSLYETAKECDPDLLVTYVNYPSTEYLYLPFLDIFCFNVFLESTSDFESYLLRLQTLAGEKPLMLTEIGLDSRRNSMEKQADLLQFQIGACYRAGCAGVFVYAWTDEWYRGGQDVDDWDFGLTTRERRPKPAMSAVQEAFNGNPVDADAGSPKISVVVCTFNGSKTIEKCLQSLFRLKYRNYEVIVIDDGSTDATADIASRYKVRLIRTSNHGLSAARNRGMLEATGAIIAYIDDDAYADSNWLNFLAIAFQDSNHACIGGPNLAPPEDRWIAQCVARAPGGPVHVLLSDSEAEHVPGCNLAIRKKDLHSIGGFDTQFRVAGDDVDLCWRLKEGGYTIGFHPGAFVWHHRRNSARDYFRQQRGYGKAEALLARKWPEKYNVAGHVSWAGRIYHSGWFSTGRIYSGIWGTAPFQSLYQRSAGMLSSMVSLPEWGLLILSLAIASMLGLDWPPLLYALAPLSIALIIPVFHAFRSARKSMESLNGTKRSHARTIFMNAVLHCMQPVARLMGRWPIWRPQYKKFDFPRSRTISVWSEHWQDASTKLTFLLEKGKQLGAILSQGDSFVRWDLQAAGGAFGSARLLMVIEEHGKGRQMTRFLIYPHCSWVWLSFFTAWTTLGVAALLHRAWIAAAMMLSFAIFLGGRIICECGRSTSAFVSTIQLLEERDEELRLS